MVRLTMRDIVAMLLCLWLPLSSYLLFSHTSQVRNEITTDLRSELLRQLRRDHEAMAPHEFGENGGGHAHTHGGARKLDGEKKVAGWPTNPLFDPDHRAVRVEELNMVELEDASWKQVTDKLMSSNRWMLEAAPPATNITLVSGIWDLGRDKIKTSEQWKLFKRPFSHYTSRLEAFLAYDFPKVLYCEQEHWPEIKEKILASKGGPTRVIFKSKDDVRREFRDFDLLQNIRKQKKWLSRADWLASAPQASMELYNPVVMSKLYYTRDVARWNPHQTSAFLWIDSAHLCNNPNAITVEKLPYMLTFLDRLLITYFDYQPYQEIHGFEHKAFDKYLGVSPSDSTPLKIGRGGVFGGRREYLEVAASVYEVMLSETLSHGVMGTEENLFSMLDYHYPELIHHFDNKEGGNCAIFDAWTKHVDYAVSGYDVRGLDCRYVSADDAVRCFYNGKTKCPSHVTPLFLAKAEGQGLCQGHRQYYCEVVCTPGGKVDWHGLPCKGHPGKCPPPKFMETDFSKARGLRVEAELERLKDAAAANMVEDPMHMPEVDEERKAVEAQEREKQEREDRERERQAKERREEREAQEQRRLKEKQAEEERARQQQQQQQQQSGPLAGPEVAPPPPSEAVSTTGTGLTGREALAGLSEKDVGRMEKFGFDLRGLKCQVLNGKERCYNEDDFHREMCPPHVTSAYLTLSKGQWSCEPEQTDMYCTATCQEGVTRIAWSAHDYKYCAKSPDNCPPIPKITPVDQYSVPAWDGKPRQKMTCSEPAGGMPKFTAAMLVRTEAETLRNTLKTYVKSGFLEAVDEFILYVNQRSAAIEEAVADLLVAPYNVKLMGDDENHGITYPMTWMVGNATNEHVLFLEKDFQVVESLPCVMEQMAIGLGLIDDGTAHVVKYRSRHLPGKPNWAEISYRGKEESVFKRQPNLLCNFYHWIDNPETRWGEYFWPCHPDKGVDGSAPKNKVFYCSKAKYCNWTNNPVLFTKSWWMNEYVNNRFHIKSTSHPYKNLEGWMNWQKGAWNDEPWVVAFGEGMFKHADVKNFGGGW